LAFSPNGRRLTGKVGAGELVWEVPPGPRPRTLRGHRGKVYGVAFHPDGKRLISGGADRTVREWDLSTGEEVGLPREYSGPVTDVAFSPDGKYAASVPHEKFRWLYSGGPIRKNPPSFAGDPVAGAGINIATGQRIIGLGMGPARLGQTTVIAGGPVTYITPEGRPVVQQFVAGRVRVWDAASGRVLRTLHDGQEEPINSVAFSPDSTRLAGAAGQVVKVWDVRDGREVLLLKGHAADIRGVAFSPDGKRLASASNDRKVKLWDTATDKLIRTFRGHTAAVASVTFSPDGKRLAGGAGNGVVKVWDAATGKEQLSLPRQPGMVGCVLFSPDGRRLVTACRSSLTVWDAETAKELVHVGDHADMITWVAFSRDGRQLASSSEDGTVKVWDLKGTELRK
jgi:WD40 repeat protein